MTPKVPLFLGESGPADYLAQHKRRDRSTDVSRWCIKLWDNTSLGGVQVVGFFDVAARLCAGDGPIAALVGGSSCSIGCALQHRTFNDYKNNIAV